MLGGGFCWEMNGTTQVGDFDCCYFYLRTKLSRTGTAGDRTVSWPFPVRTFANLGEARRSSSKSVKTTWSTWILTPSPGAGHSLVFDLRKFIRNDLDRLLFASSANAFAKSNREFKVTRIERRYSCAEMSVKQYKIPSSLCAPNSPMDTIASAVVRKLVWKDNSMIRLMIDLVLM